MPLSGLWPLAKGRSTTGATLRKGSVYASRREDERRSSCGIVSLDVGGACHWEAIRQSVSPMHGAVPSRCWVRWPGTGDPAQVRREARDADTFGDLAQLYLDKHAQVKKRSWREDLRIIRSELFPLWKGRRAREIRRRDVRELVEAIAERPAPIMANRVLALIRKMFNFAIAREVVDFNPCAQLERPGKERQRSRVLTDEEIRTFWKKLDPEPVEFAAAFRLRLITAQRGGGSIRHALGRC